MGTKIQDKEYSKIAFLLEERRFFVIIDSKNKEPTDTENPFVLTYILEEPPPSSKEPYLRRTSNLQRTPQLRTSAPRTKKPSPSSIFKGEDLVEDRHRPRGIEDRKVLRSSGPKFKIEEERSSFCGSEDHRVGSSYSDQYFNPDSRENNILNPRLRRSNITRCLLFEHKSPQGRYHGTDDNLRPNLCSEDQMLDVFRSSKPKDRNTSLFQETFPLRRTPPSSKNHPSSKKPSYSTFSSEGRRNRNAHMHGKDITCLKQKI